MSLIAKRGAWSQHIINFGSHDLPVGFPSADPCDRNPSKVVGASSHNRCRAIAKSGPPQWISQYHSADARRAISPPAAPLNVRDAVSTRSRKSLSQHPSRRYASDRQKPWRKREASPSTLLPATLEGLAVRGNVTMLEAAVPPPITALT